MAVGFLPFVLGSAFAPSRRGRWFLVWLCVRWAFASSLASADFDFSLASADLTFRWHPPI
ncbi:hypothetical protein ATN79_22210 [Paraburkholderia caribensis]|nr:hypothetical protein ATN79_22210 [Paraburkholderia caribensis]